MNVHSKLRDYQIQIAQNADVRLTKLGIVYLAMEVRTGKTLTAFETARLYGAQSVLFLTKKKAISSIESDYTDFEYDKYFKLTCINDESMHKIEGQFDLVIHDEHHRFGAFPKPNKSARLFKQRFAHLPMIFLSGTPSPESWSQIYHQFWVSNRSPFKRWTTFYKWANDFVNKKQKYVAHGNPVNDYSDADQDKIKGWIQDYMIYFTQSSAGFETQVNETILNVRMQDKTYEYINRLKKHLVIEGKSEVILADTGVKLMQKCHQMYSGTIKFESGQSMVLDKSKAEFIQGKFYTKKIAIFYKFRAEFDMLCDVLGERITTDIDEFNSDESKWIALQIVSGREGVNLSSADYLVYLNIDFSAVSYWQSRDRLTTMQRKTNDVFWIFSENGIEHDIYKTVMSKKDYTLKHFNKTIK